MRVAYFAKLFLIASFLLLSTSAFADVPIKEAAQSLPDQFSDFHALSAAQIPSGFTEVQRAQDYGITSAATRYYRRETNPLASYHVTVLKAQSDSEAYALLTAQLSALRGQSGVSLSKLEGVGTVGFAKPGAVLFFKGVNFVIVSAAILDRAPDESILIARSFAETLDAGAGEIPPLAMHLPAWETAQERAVYAVSLSGLQMFVRNQSVLDAVSFEGGAEAVTAKYEQGQLVIIEFQTPQLAADNDARIGQRIAELRAQKQAVPSAYRRVGNYAVFVFDAPSEQAANGLIVQVKYEKVVQWLGEDPHRFERANRFWLNMSGSLIINTIKATALAILLCLGIGGVFGSVIFARRRAQAALHEQYTDAGGMVRLNLDELVAQPAPTRLLPPGDE